MPAPKSRSVPRDVDAIVAWLKAHGTAKARDGMARYGLPSDRAVGVGVGALQKLAKGIGPDQTLAEALWDTGIYEARLLASFVGEADKVTPALMDRWCADFDNWGVVDTVCFKLFDRSPHAWKKIRPWSRRSDEFQKRAGVVLLACVAAHNAEASEETLLPFLPLIAKVATDERNFVKKGTLWALRMLGLQGGRLYRESLQLAQTLAASESPSARWIGREAARELRKRHDRSAQARL